MSNYYFFILIPFLFTYLSMPFFRKLAFYMHILDVPNEKRKIHKTAVPLLGGLAIYCAVILGVSFAIKEMYFMLPMLIGVTIILIVGLINDARHLSAQVRLVWQIIAAVIIIMLGARVTFMPKGLLGNIIEVIITLVWIVGVTNAYNYLDGLDGLAAGSAVINSICFAVILYSTAQYAMANFIIILASACLAFLPYNFRKKNKLFLGDAGSTFIGFVLAVVGLLGNWAQDNFVKISIPILILGVPIFDMIFTTIIRIKEEKISTVVEWLKYTGRDHFHHYLVDIGLRPKGAVLFIYGITLALGLSAIMVSNDRPIEAVLTLSQAAIIFGIIGTIIVVGKRRRSGWNIPE